MSQYKNFTVDVTNSNAAVVGHGTQFLTKAAVGGVFTVIGSSVPYVVGSITDDTHLTLSSNYAGTTASGVDAAISTSFTPVRGLPYPELGDVDTATTLKRAMLKLDVLGTMADQSAAAVAITGGTIAGVTFPSLTASRAVFTDGSKGLVSNAITGSGNVVMSASPTLSGTLTAAAITASGTFNLSGLTASTALALDGSKNVVSVTNTGSGNNVLSASPTLTGTLTAAAIAASTSIAVSATAPLYLDGGGDTYWQEVSANVVRLIAGSGELIRFTSSTGVTTVTGQMALTGNVLPTTSSNGTAGIAPNQSHGAVVQGKGSVNDSLFLNSAGSAWVLNPTGTTSAGFQGTVTIATSLGIAGASVANALDVLGSIRMQGGAQALKFNNGSVEQSISHQAGAGGGFAINAYVSATTSSGSHQLNSSVGNAEVVSVTNNNGTAAQQYGIGLILTGDPNDGTRYFFQGLGNATARIKGLSNGGLANFSANNVNLSDARTKTPLEVIDRAKAQKYWDATKKIEYGTCLYKDQTDSNTNLCTTAQSVEAAAPWLTQGALWDEWEDADSGYIDADFKPITYKRRKVQPMKGIYEQDRAYQDSIVLQEAQHRIEELTAKLAALEKTVATLIH